MPLPSPLMVRCDYLPCRIWWTLAGDRPAALATSRIEDESSAWWIAASRFSDAALAAVEVRST